MLIFQQIDVSNSLEVVSKPQISPKNKTWADEKAQHTWEYVSILRRTKTPLLGVRWGFETTSIIVTTNLLT